MTSFEGDILVSKGKQVVFYSIPSSVECEQVRHFLLTHGALFTEVDVTKSAFAAEQLMKRTGSIQTPVIDASGFLVKGFDEKALLKALSSPSLPSGQ